jgi:hypothetical protein
MKRDENLALAGLWHGKLVHLQDFRTTAAIERRSAHHIGHHRLPRQRQRR